MGKFDKILLQVLTGSSDCNVIFSDLCNLLKQLEFDLRIRGSHHIFSRPDVAEILNVQDKQGKAKPYQVKQVRDVILKYKLARLNDD